jgi:hypothetical protein
MASTGEWRENTDGRLMMNSEASSGLFASVTDVVRRFGFSQGNLLFSTLIVFFLLLFFEELPSDWHSLVAALICYVLLLAFLASFEMRMIVFSDTKRKVAGKGPKGLPLWALVVSLVGQVAGFVFIAYYVFLYRGLA